MAAKLFVGGLSWDTTDDTLRKLFEQAGTVESARVITDRYSGRSKGFGFVEMATAKEAEKAKQELNGKELDGRTIAIDDARPQAPREDRSGGSSFGRDRRGGRGDRY